MSRVVHFEMEVSDFPRAINFYENVFGWKLTRMPSPVDYWITESGDGPGINGGFTVPERMQGQKTINTVQVVSVDDTLKRVESLGGSTASPKIAIPGVGWFAYVKDPEGTLLGVLEPGAGAQ